MSRATRPRLRAVAAAPEAPEAFTYAATHEQLEALQTSITEILAVAWSLDDDERSRRLKDWISQAAHVVAELRNGGPLL